ncbi:Hypothetical protein KK9_0581 [Borreliella garinii BgVir]|nr:Hypothetical protein KK9_0581 [Borreliella garinii BgVir]
MIFKKREGLKLSFFIF